MVHPWKPCIWEVCIQEVRNPEVKASLSYTVSLGKAGLQETLSKT